MNEYPPVLPSKALRSYSLLLVISILGLIFLGALVKSHDAGLSVPDWPTSFGENMFTFPPSKWIDKIWYEHVHRLVASGIGALTVIAALWVTWTSGISRGTKYLAWGCVFAVCLQGLLGGLTVRHMLPAILSASHGVLAQSFLVLTIVLAYRLSPEFAKRRASTALSGDRKLFLGSSLFFLCVFMQLVLGAVMRHTESGLAVPDFPLVGGQLIPSLGPDTLASINGLRAGIQLPSVTQEQVLYHLLHRFFGIFLFVVGIPLALLGARSAREKALKKSFFFVAGVLLIQFLFGIFSIWTRREVNITSFHVLFGALLLGSTAVLALRAYPMVASSNKN